MSKITELSASAITTHWVCAECGHETEAMLNELPQLQFPTCTDVDCYIYGDQMVLQSAVSLNS